MKGDRLTVVLNGKTVLDKAQLPGVPEKGALALQHHGGKNAKFAELEYSANAVGVCDAAVEMAMHHAKTETRGGRPLASSSSMSASRSRMPTM